MYNFLEERGKVICVCARLYLLSGLNVFGLATFRGASSVAFDIRVKMQFVLVRALA